MRRFLILFLSIILFGCNNEKEEVVNTFKEFNKANIELNGEKIFELSDTASHNYYKSLLTKILELDSVRISELNLSEKINLLSARAVIKDSELKRLSTKDLMIKMYTEVNSMDTVKINSINKTGIANIRINNKEAISDLTINGKTLSPAVNLKFSKESGKWKFNVISMANFADKQLNTICEQNGFTHIDFIKWIFNASNIGDKKIKELHEIWNPIIK
ncbi:hypothetical protein [uncultured Psychroserpens sp.]|uniref:hypothetical protein n=1 Tax=uncultured Psychroserpens sp. TaxID=255436 RepID=UPI002612D74D|nr:hypothetical protein [uncultured Psychroserpens sp.]